MDTSFILQLFAMAKQSLKYDTFLYQNCVILSVILVLLTSFVFHNISKDTLIRSSNNGLVNIAIFMDTVKRIDKVIPSLPLEFWGRNKHSGNSSLPKVPSLLDLDFTNEFWQRQHTSNGTFQLLSAYLDNRVTNPDQDHFVRILVVIKQLYVMESVQMHCQLWYANLNESIVVPVDTENYLWRRNWGYNAPEMWQPHLIACRLPEGRRNSVAPVAVSLVENGNDLATNCLRIFNVKPNARENFAVVVKALDFYHDENVSVKLVEWIELLRLLGAQKLFLYVLQVHPNIQKVLDHYSSDGFVSVHRTKWPGGFRNTTGQTHSYSSNQVQLELIPFNDCFYRNLYNYKYLAVIDVDEIIMPTGNLTSWAQMMDVVQERIRNSEHYYVKYANYAFHNAYFLDRFYTAQQRPVAAEFDPELPAELHMVRHTARAREHNHIHWYAKSFFSTEHTVTLHNHYPIDCQPEPCYYYYVPLSDGQLNHYRLDCDLATFPCEVTDTFVEDKTIDKWSGELIPRSLETIRKLELLPTG